MLTSLRLAGIAIGSLVAAGLVMGLVGWMIPGLAGPLSGVVTLVLGGLIYADIRRRDHRAL
jgi:hypothetical protein